MGKTTAIEWTDSTWNPWQGCTKVSPGCDHCYAETLTKRWGNDFSKLRRSSDATFYAPLRWEKKAAVEGKQLLVFTCSMSDFFHRQADPWRKEAWDIMRHTPHLTYQVLTKRPGLAVDWYKKHGWLPNVWLGTSVESAKYLPRLDVLARVPAPVRFVSVEPILGPLSLKKWLLPQCEMCRTVGCYDCDCDECLDVGEAVLSWVIVGGESGPEPRPMHPDWPSGLRDQCQSAGVPFFFKQWGSWMPEEAFLQDDRLPEKVRSPIAWVEENGEVHRFGGGKRLDQMVNPVLIHKVGKKAAGALLDGREWREMPDAIA